MPRSARKPPRPTRSWWLRRADQAAVAALLLAALGTMALWWIAQGGPQGRLIDVDDAPPLRARFTVDINTADWPELTTLPEVGETLARRIVESRERDGPFRDQQDLQRVRGIGPRTLERIKPYLEPLPEMEATAGP
jgi:competence protein ComEA